MGDFLAIEVKGLAELKRRLALMPEAIQKKVSKGMVASAAAVFQREAVARAPVYPGQVGKNHPPPGTLKSAIYQFRWSQQSGGTREAWLVTVRRGRTAKGSIDAYYAHIVEYGSVKMSARPFMRPAFEVKKQEATEAMRKYLADHLPEAVESAK
jgi:HK97 gp10 family phage protein